MMENLKDLIRKVGHNTVPAAWLMNDASLDGGTSKLERLTDFAEALLAEITKKNDPVAWMQISIEEGIEERFPRSTKPNKFNREWWRFEPLYAFPISTEQIENRVAEACAELLDTEWNGDADTYAEAEIANQCANSIRSGAWKEYLK